nr:integrase core domain-containing protein [Gluconobacter sphaericus]
MSKESGINPKTVAKWRKRQSVEDQKTGPKEPRSTVLSETDEAMIVAFRRHTLLLLDDCLYALQASIVTQLVEKADRNTAWKFLEYLLSVIPYRIHIILTDNGIQFAKQRRSRNTALSRPMRFEVICKAHGIKHRLTKPNHPWTNGQVERMNRTIREAAVKRFHYDSHEQLRTRLNDFMTAYNFGQRLKTLNGLTPYEYVCKIWTSEPEKFIINPDHQIQVLNTWIKI